MVVESVIVGIIDKARIESDLFWRPDIIEIGRLLKIPQIIVVLGSRHGGGRAADGIASGGEVWREDTS